MKPKPKPKPKQKRDVRSFEIEPVVASLLKNAVASTGKNQTALINKALLRYLGPLVKELIREREKALAKFKTDWTKNGSKKA